jgi:hypothetical protein
VKIIDAARVIRSKNAGPLTLTIDLMFDDRSIFERALSAPALRPVALAEVFVKPVDSIRIIPYPAALAIKLVFDRSIVAGTPGDTDVYGAQQHAPILEVEI